MAHKHSVYDTDAHFKIDGVTRAVKNDSATKTVLVQNDHNSERFTFELPRYVDGHDMSLCNVVQIHYINIASVDKSKNYPGVYEVDDLQVSPDDEEVVILSWLISRNATQYVGNLSFAIHFACTSGEDDYAWNTAKHTNIYVTEGIYNGEVIEDEYADILNQWSAKLADLEDSVAELEQAVENGGTGTDTKPKAVSIDFTNFDNGRFFVTYADGTASNFTVTFDDAGNPVNISDGTNDFTIVWGE